MPIKLARKHNIWYLYVGFIGLSILSWFVNFFAPTQTPVLAIFFVLLFCTIASILMFILNNVRRSIEISLAVVGFLILRMLNLRQPLYPLLLIAALASLEVYLSKR